MIVTIETNNYSASRTGDVYVTQTNSRPVVLSDATVYTNDWDVNVQNGIVSVPKPTLDEFKISVAVGNVTSGGKEVSNTHANNLLNDIMLANSIAPSIVVVNQWRIQAYITGVETKFTRKHAARLVITFRPTWPYWMRIGTQTTPSTSGVTWFGAHLIGWRMTLPYNNGYGTITIRNPYTGRDVVCGAVSDSNHGTLYIRNEVDKTMLDANGNQAIQYRPQGDSMFFLSPGEKIDVRAVNLGSTATKITPVAFRYFPPYDNEG